jgi:hypothetical protein
MLIHIKTIISGRKYGAHYDGELIATGRDVTYKAARVLRERELRGPVAFTAPDSDVIALRGDVDKLADRSIRETSKEGPREVKYSPFDMK